MCFLHIIHMINGNRDINLTSDYLKSLQYVKDPSIDILLKMTSDVVTKIQQQTREYSYEHEANQSV